MPSSPFPIDPQDWTTLWQSELAAMAADRELAETIAAGAGAWNAAAWTKQEQARGDAGPTAATDGPARSEPPKNGPARSRPPEDGPARSDATPRPAPGGAVPGDGKAKRPSRIQRGSKPKRVREP